jgi:hypothetical protein
MQLAKNVIDVGLSTNDLEPMLRFWQQDVGLRFDHVLPVRRGQKQYRHDAQGSVIKLNHHAEPLPEAASSGYRELIIAREGLQKPRRMVDPDGNRVQLVPPGYDGVTDRLTRPRTAATARRAIPNTSAFGSAGSAPAPCGNRGG